MISCLDNDYLYILCNKIVHKSIELIYFYEKKSTSSKGFELVRHLPV